MNRPEETAWPLPPAPEDPWAGEDLLPAEAPETRFEALARLALAGRIPLSDPRLAAAAREAGLDVSSEAVPQPVGAPLVPPDAWLAEIAEDLLPDVGLLAPDRVLGPAADEAPDARALVLAAAVLALAPFDRPRVRPVDRWLREKGPAAHRAALRAVDRAPTGLWRVQGDRCLPLLPLDPAWVPPGVPLRAPRLEEDPVEALPPGVWVARVLPGPGERWIAALACPAGPDPGADLLLHRLRLEAWRLRGIHPGLGWHDVLRDRGEVLYRWVHERAALAPEVPS